MLGQIALLTRLMMFRNKGPPKSKKGVRDSHTCTKKFLR